MKYWIGKNIHLVPKLLILITLIVSFLEIGMKQSVILGNSFGYSMFAVLPMIYIYFYTGEFSQITKTCVIGLFAISVYNTIASYFFLNDDTYEFYKTYENNFSILICSIVFLLGVIIYITPKK